MQPAVVAMIWGKVWKCDPNAKRVIVPASVPKLGPYCSSFENATAVEEITFEPGSQIIRLKTSTFGQCIALKSLCIAASVEIICEYCFVTIGSTTGSALEKVTFEPGSRLDEIESLAFFGCILLKSLCLPASVEMITAESFSDSGLKEILVESTNPFIRMDGPFLVDFPETWVVQYFGNEPEVTIPETIETIGRRCFSSNDAISRVQFPRTSVLSSIRTMAFAHCKGLQSIAFPASVTTLGRSCFWGCTSLQVVSFGDGSELTKIEGEAFGRCDSLKVITFPSSLETIGASCFTSCPGLEEIRFPEDSKLVAIGDRAFHGCSGLKAFHFPPLVESVGDLCFGECWSLTDFTFSIGCRLRELKDLPPLWTGLREIPDSVEILRFCGYRDGRFEYTLHFGRDSKLIQIRAQSQPEGLPCRSFLGVSSRSLKVFRSTREFARGS
jgi:hypothetical protein